MQIKRLINAVIEIDSSAIINGTAENRITPRLLNLRQAVTPREAFYSKAEDIDFWKAEGRVCAEFIIPYPPGIPLVSPGEEITEEMLEYISFIVKNGVEITGVKSKALEKLRVLS